MNNEISWDVPHHNNYNSYITKQNKIFNLWENIFTSKELSDALHSESPIITEETLQVLSDNATNQIEKFYGSNGDEFIEECGIAIQLIKLCDGSKKFFKLVDDLEYRTSQLKWILRDYIKKISIQPTKYQELLDQLKQSALSTIESYIVERKVKLMTTRSEVNIHYLNVIREWEKDANLEKIWDDRDYHNLSWEGNRTAFYVLFTLDKDEFIRVIQKFQDPYSLKMAIHSVESELNIKTWKYFFEKANDAFDINGTWDKNNLLLPVLMYVSDFKLSSLMQRFNVNMNTTQGELDLIQQKLDKLVEYILNTTSNKSNLGTFRWILYKFKELRSNEIINIFDQKEQELPKTYVYLNSKFILDYSHQFIMAVNHDGKQHQLRKWSNPLDYEEWFFHTFLGLCIEEQTSESEIFDIEPTIKNLQIIKISKEFFYKWNFNTSNWYGVKGDLFREETSNFKYYSNKFEFKNDKFYYLAFLLFINIKTTQSLELWNNLLLSGDLFLDILKYSKYRDADYVFDNHSEARYTLSLISIVGLNLTMFLANDNNFLAKEVYSSFYDFTVRCFESDTINEQYFSIIKLLGFLRLNSESSPNSNFKILSDALPNIEEILFNLKPYNKYFFELIYFLSLNGLSNDNLKSILSENSSLDFDKQIAIFNKMIRIDKKRYSFSEEFNRFMLNLDNTLIN